MGTQLFPVPVDSNWESGMLQPAVVVNTNARRVEVLALPVIDFAAAEPGSPSDGDLYVVTTPWLTGLAGELAYYYDGAWTFWVPFVGMVKHIDGALYQYAPDTTDEWQPYVPVLPALVDAVDDAAALAAGVPLHGLYVTGSAVKRRAA